MYCYYFILGQNKNLSIVEILNRPEIKRLKLNKKAIFLIENVLFLETELEIDVKRLITLLGGTIKIGKIEKTYKDFSEIKPRDVVKIIKNRDGKIPFGFSTVSVKSRRFLKNLAISIKKDFRSNKINSRWIEAKDLELSSVVVVKNKIIEKGAEIYLFKGEKKIYMGKTLAVQDFESYSKRDYGRPGRDISSGMIPPKLAQIMINLTGVQPNDIFLDPFCGSGTFLQEAILMGQKNIIGSDISEKAVKDSRENIKWLKEEYTLEEFEFNLFQKDICEISDTIKKGSIDGIATEPYLGPTARHGEIDKLKSELKKLYIKAFSEIKKIVKIDGKVVIILPALNLGKKLMYLDILDDIKRQGFNVAKFIPQDLEHLIRVDKRGSILYMRPTPNQRVAREIFIFRRK
jgi:tRNA G10  N-methylase Trm11